MYWLHWKVNIPRVKVPLLSVHVGQLFSFDLYLVLTLFTSKVGQ